MIVVDTGVLYALADRRDAHHRQCARWLATTSEPLVVPPLVVAEACYLIGTQCGPEVEATFLETFGPGRQFRLENLGDLDMARMASLVRQYADLPLGGTDAAVVTVAERLGVTKVATVDHRHFRVVRPTHVPSFTLLPGDEVSTGSHRG